MPRPPAGGGAGQATVLPGFAELAEALGYSGLSDGGLHLLRIPPRPELEDGTVAVTGVAVDSTTGIGTFAAASADGRLAVGWYRDGSGTACPADAELLGVAAALELRGGEGPLRIAAYSPRICMQLGGIVSPLNRPRRTDPRPSVPQAASTLRRRLRERGATVTDQGHTTLRELTLEQRELAFQAALLANRLLLQGRAPDDDAAVVLYQRLASDSPSPVRWSEIAAAPEAVPEAAPDKADEPTGTPDPAALPFAAAPAGTTAEELEQLAAADYPAFAAAVLAEAAGTAPAALSELLRSPAWCALWLDTLTEWEVTARIEVTVGITAHPPGHPSTTRWERRLKAVRTRLPPAALKLRRIAASLPCGAELPGRSTAARLAAEHLGEEHAAEFTELRTALLTGAGLDPADHPGRPGTPRLTAVQLTQRGQLPPDPHRDRARTLLDLPPRDFTATVENDATGRRPEPALRSPELLGRWTAELEQLSSSASAAADEGGQGSPDGALALPFVSPRDAESPTRPRLHWHRRYLAGLRQRHLESRWLAHDLQRRWTAGSPEAATAREQALLELVRRYPEEAEQQRALLAEAIPSGGLVTPLSPERLREVREAEHARAAEGETSEDEAAAEEQPGGRPARLASVRVRELTVAPFREEAKAKRFPQLTTVLERRKDSGSGAFAVVGSDGRVFLGEYRLELPGRAKHTLLYGCAVAVREVLRRLDGPEGPEDPDDPGRMPNGKPTLAFPDEQPVRLLRSWAAASPFGAVSPRGEADWPPMKEAAQEAAARRIGVKSAHDTTPEKGTARALAQAVLQLDADGVDLDDPSVPKLVAMVREKAETAPRKTAGVYPLWRTHGEFPAQPARAANLPERAIPYTAQGEGAEGQPERGVRGDGNMSALGEHEGTVPLEHRVRAWSASLNGAEYGRLLAERLEADGMFPKLASAVDCDPAEWTDWFVGAGLLEADPPGLAELLAADDAQFRAAVLADAVGESPAPSLFHSRLLSRWQEALPEVFAELAATVRHAAPIGLPIGLKQGARTLPAGADPEEWEARWGRLRAVQQAYTVCRGALRQLRTRMHQAAETEVTEAHRNGALDDLTARHPQVPEVLREILGAEADDAGRVPVRDRAWKAEVLRRTRAVLDAEGDGGSDAGSDAGGSSGSAG